MVTVIEMNNMRNCVCILLDTGEKFWLLRNDLKNTRITEGMICERDFLLQQIRIVQYPHALNLAVSMLARRPYSKREISSAMIRRHFIQDVVDLVLIKLEKEHFIDDRAFSEQWIRFRTEKGYGPSLIRYELKQKGISEEIIQQSLYQTDSDAEYANAVILARKAWTRLESEKDIRKKRQKAIAVLVRKGYGWDEAKHACETVENEQNKERCTY